MTSDKKIIRNSRERGNALFLILIAVALFAALSYAITQSGRGGGSVSQQTALITAGQVTEQPADVRSATTRMILTGITGTSIVFDTSASQNNVFDTVTGGGGATNVPPPSSACEVAADCNAGWVYVPAYVSTGHKGYFITGVGSAGVNGSVAMALLKGTSGVTQQVCMAIQKGLGYATSTPPILATAIAMTAADANTQTTGYAVGGNVQTFSDGGGTPVLTNQDFACVQNAMGGVYAYYGALIDQ